MFTEPWSDERPHALVPLSFDFIPMTPGLVSIILPSLNALEFLVPRIESILEQTYHYWEAIVLDSHSDDGTWEYFQEVAAKDPRFRIFQIPRDGLYAALNRGIDLATGEYFHIATCDDTMEPTFLEETIAALRDHPEAGIAATDLQYIDKEGKPDDTATLGRGYVRTCRCGETMTAINFRPPLHDSLLHFSMETVYFSLTQLLIRSSVLSNAHPFRTTVGSVADFEWAMNLSRITGTVHIPKKLATWRSHGAQLSYATDPSRGRSREVACLAFVNSSECRIGWFRGRALLIPAWRDNPSDHPVKSSFLAAAVLCGVFSLIEVILRPRTVLRSIAAARFGKCNLKESWISFLMNQWDIVPSSAVETVTAHDLAGQKLKT
jgi:glycosyltransferase involved in cell wall biosynthesis